MEPECKFRDSLHTHIRLEDNPEISVNTPVVWNSNMYHSPEIAEILKSWDVYLGDFKYGNNVCARKYSKIRNYLEIVQPNSNRIQNRRNPPSPPGSTRSPGMLHKAYCRMGCKKHPTNQVQPHVPV